MTYGPAKRRDIARSVLPSTSRLGARQDLAGIKRRARRNLRRDLHTIAHPGAAGPVLDAWDAAPIGPATYPSGEIRSAVWRRRSSDKLGPLLRWAKATTADVPIEDRLTTIARHFDDNLIGRHALGHVADTRHFRIPSDVLSWWDRLGAGVPGPSSAPRIEAVALAALEDGRHGELTAG